jgi:protein-S-isoprenylcysteine O-methyltransferase Ste14
MIVLLQVGNLHQRAKQSLPLMADCRGLGSRFVPVAAEEDFLVREFGGQYRAYQQRTCWRFLPFIY